MVHAKGQLQRAEMKTTKTIEYGGRHYNGGQVPCMGRRCGDGIIIASGRFDTRI